MSAMTAASNLVNCNNFSPSESGGNSSNTNLALSSPQHVNANWNSDSWADGEFEPIDETSTGRKFSNFS